MILRWLISAIMSASVSATADDPCSNPNALRVAEYALADFLEQSTKGLGYYAVSVGECRPYWAEDLLRVERQKKDAGAIIVNCGVVAHFKRDIDLGEFARLMVHFEQTHFIINDVFGKVMVPVCGTIEPPSIP